MNFLRRLNLWHAFLLCVAFTFIIRGQTFGSPTLEFDEQFYLVVGDRMLSGAIPFVDIWDRKPVGLFLIYAAIRLLGGEGVLEYQIVAALFAATTAWIIYIMAIQFSDDRFGSLCSAFGYLIWLNLLQGQGGQASVFYNLLVIIAASIVFRAHVNQRTSLLATGIGVMLLIGVAIQIKYTVAIEGIFFGLWLLMTGFKRKQAYVRLFALGAIWAGVAALPTVIVGYVYYLIGHFDDFIFANFTSMGSRLPQPIDVIFTDLAIAVAIIVLAVISAWAGLRRLRIKDVTAWQFMTFWIIAALLAIALIRSFGPHYFIPLMPPLMIAAAPFFASARRTAVTILLFGAIAGQGLLVFYAWSKGGRTEAETMARAIGPVPNCLYVHNGFPSLYLLTKSCLPTRFAFPGHLNMMVESTALGVDPRTEMRRLLATRPDAIVTDDPLYVLGNKDTQVVLDEVLARDYYLALKLKTGTSRYRLVYKIKRLSVASDN
jgi:hypothetical protein